MRFGLRFGFGLGLGLTSVPQQGGVDYGAMLGEISLGSGPVEAHLVSSKSWVLVNYSPDTAGKLQVSITLTLTQP